jgi:hypothetical protein
MLDFIKFKAIDYSKEEWKNLVSRPEVSQIKGSWYALNNLRLRYYPNQNELWCENSLHKYFNSALNQQLMLRVNHDDFLRIDLEKTVNDIARILRREPEKLFLFGRFEFGVNIHLDSTKPMQFINTCISMGRRHNEFHAIGKQNQSIFGKHAKFQSRSEKLYDKSHQMISQGYEVKENLLRYEIVLYGTRKIKSVLRLGKPPTLYDILKHETIQVLANELISSFSRINVVPIDECESNQLAINFLSHSHPLMVKFHKKILSRYRFNQIRKEGKYLMEKYKSDEDSLFFSLTNKINRKTELLTN